MLLCSRLNAGCTLPAGRACALHLPAGLGTRACSTHTHTRIHTHTASQLQLSSLPLPCVCDGPGPQAVGLQVVPLMGPTDLLLWLTAHAAWQQPSRRPPPRPPAAQPLSVPSVAARGRSLPPEWSAAVCVASSAGGRLRAFSRQQLLALPPLLQAAGGEAPATWAAGYARQLLATQGQAADDGPGVHAALQVRVHSSRYANAHDGHVLHAADAAGCPAPVHPTRVGKLPVTVTPAVWRWPRYVPPASWPCLGRCRRSMAS